jgi:tetratricopeptide (TPR) repeat protein
MAVKMTRRSRLLLVTAVGALAFGVAATIAATRWVAAAATPTYRPGDDVDGITAELARSLPPDYPRVRFADVTRAAGIEFRHFHGARRSWLPEDMGSGAAWGDYDGDGWLDLVVANEAGSIDESPGKLARSPARLTLYHNDRDGTFSDATDRAGLDLRGWLMAVAWADYDGDGHLDLLVTAHGHNALYRGNGDGTFTDRSAASGIGGPEGFWAGAAWGDYDRDGRLDLYVTGYVKFTRKSTTTGVTGKYDVENPSSINPLAFPPERNLLFHNDGDGTFAERGAAAGVTDVSGRGLAATWTDLDEDGWPDLYVANDVSQNALFRNRGDGTFQNVAETAHASDYRSSMGIAVGDWNGDGAQDLFLTHWLAQGNALYDNQLHRAGATHVGKKTPLAFMDESERYGLGQVSLDYTGWATSFVDYDNDGRLDLFVVNGSTLQKRDEPSAMVPMQSKLFWNRGPKEGFFDVSPVGGRYFQTAYVGRGAAFADYDNDGDVDVFVVNHGAAGVLLRNEGGNRNHWAEIALRGARSNRAGLGATVRLVAGGVAQVRQVGSQAPYLSQNAAIESFGLGAASRIDTIEVRWPSGARDVRTGVMANQRVTIEEGAAPEARQPAEIGGASRSNTANVPGSAPTTSAPPDRAQVQRFWSLYREASTFRIAHDIQRAADGYAQALALNPLHEDALYYAGSMRVELGDYAAAADAWRRLLAVNPNSARTHSQLGALYACLDREAPFRIDSAEWHLQRAHELNKEENGPLLHLAEAALMRGDRASARGFLGAVLENDVSNTSAHFYMGYLALRDKDLARAREELRRASTSPAAAPKPKSAASGEGDTKLGVTPLRRDGTRCGQLRAAAQRARALGPSVDPVERYRDLETLLSEARRRAH